MASATIPRPRVLRRYSRNRKTLEPRIFGTNPSLWLSRTVGVTYRLEPFNSPKRAAPSGVRPYRRPRAFTSGVRHSTSPRSESSRSARLTWTTRRSVSSASCLGTFGFGARDVRTFSRSPLETTKLKSDQTWPRAAMVLVGWSELNMSIETEGMKRSVRIAVQMFLLGHLGIGLGLAWLLSTRSSVRIDYRLVLFGSILPDLIDKPLALVLSLEGRLWAHTFLFLFAILALSFAPSWRGLRLVGFGVSTPLLLDRIWNQPAVVLYPAYGWTFPAASFNVGFWGEALLPHPLIQACGVVRPA